VTALFLCVLGVFVNFNTKVLHITVEAVGVIIQDTASANISCN